ncbi:FimD/PapC N-terminal domain-containing protein [Pseudomonas sp. PCH446]
MPGTYRVDIYLNRNLSARRDLVFARNATTGQVEPCLTLRCSTTSGWTCSVCAASGC